MKRIIATIKPERVEEALDGLAAIGMQNASVTKVTAVGPERVEQGCGSMSVELGRYSIEMARVEFFSPDRFAQECIEIVLAAADTNRPCGGIVSISPVEKLISVNGRKELT